MQKRPSIATACCDVTGRSLSDDGRPGTLCQGDETMGNNETFSPEKLPGKVVDVFPFKTMKPTATKLTPMMMPRWATHAPGQSKKLLAAGSLPQLTNQFC